jgi:hypothetical protein
MGGSVGGLVALGIDTRKGSTRLSWKEVEGGGRRVSAEKRPAVTVGKVYEKGGKAPKETRKGWSVWKRP